MDPVQHLKDINISPIDIDLQTIPIFGFRRNTINGIAFTSNDGESSSGFNYSFGMIKTTNNNSYYDMEFIRKHNILPPYYHNKPTKYYYLIQDCFSKLEKMGLILFRARLSLIRANSVIPEHRDTPLDTDYCIKLHIPIQTNNNAKFIFGDSKFSLLLNNAYLANVAKLHSFENLGNEDRYHIIADCIVTNPTLPFYCNNYTEIISFYEKWYNMLSSDTYIREFNQEKNS